METLLKLEVTWCDTLLSRSQFRVLELFVKAKLVQGCHCGAVVWAKSELMSLTSSNK